MKKQQVAWLSGAGGSESSQLRENVRAAREVVCRNELARLRIERNRAARHARGAIARFTFS